LKGARYLRAARRTSNSAPATSDFATAAALPSDVRRPLRGGTRAAHHDQTARPWLRNRPHLKVASNARFAENLRLHMIELTAENFTLSDGIPNMSPTRICRFVADVFARVPA
jgi:hypothetical protein